MSSCAGKVGLSSVGSAPLHPMVTWAIDLDAYPASSSAALGAIKGPQPWKSGRKHITRDLHTSFLRMPRWSSKDPSRLFYAMTELIPSSTIGAGDTFIAGILYACLVHEDDWPLEQKLEFANELAGRKVVQEGFTGLGQIMRNSL